MCVRFEIIYYTSSLIPPSIENTPESLFSANQVYNVL